MCVRSRVWFFATPYTLACQAPLSMGFSRQDYWSRLPFPTLEIMHIMYELDARAHSCRQVELKILYEGLFLPTQCSFTVTLQASAVMKPSFWIQSFSFHTLISSQSWTEALELFLTAEDLSLRLRPRPFLCSMALPVSPHQFPRPEAAVQVSHFFTSPTLQSPWRNETEQM